MVVLRQLLLDLQEPARYLIESASSSGAGIRLLPFSNHHSWQDVCPHVILRQSSPGKMYSFPSINIWLSAPTGRRSGCRPSDFRVNTTRTVSSRVTKFVHLHSDTLRKEIPSSRVFRRISNTYDHMVSNMRYISNLRLWQGLDASNLMFITLAHREASRNGHRTAHKVGHDGDRLCGAYAARKDQPRQSVTGGQVFCIMKS